MILAGVSELSQLILSTGEEKSVPSGSCLRIVAPPGVELESPGDDVSMNQLCAINIYFYYLLAYRIVCVHTHVHV